MKYKRGTVGRKYDPRYAAAFEKRVAKHATRVEDCIFLKTGSRRTSRGRGDVYLVTWGTTLARDRRRGKRGPVGKMIPAYHAAYMAHNKCDLPAGIQMHHTCGNWNCCNPLHLEACTPDEHTERDRIRRLTEGSI